MVVKVWDLGVFLLHGMVPRCVQCDQSTTLLGTGTGTHCHRAAPGTEREQGSEGRREKPSGCQIIATS